MLECLQSHWRLSVECAKSSLVIDSERQLFEQYFITILAR